ncbi:MAG: metal ABC transporter substrate-binding protein [Pikeienuella sp.]
MSRLAAALTLMLALAGPASADRALTVFAVNAPLADMAARLAGDRAQIAFPVPKGRDPAFWRPAIADITAAQRADLVLLNGAGYAAWTTKATLPRGRLVDTSIAFADRLIETETITHSHGSEGAHSHIGRATHVWLDFAQARAQADAIAAALIRRMPEAQAEIAASLAALTADLDALDVEAQAIGARLAGVPLLASHPRYQYFARAYGMTIDSVAWDPQTPPEAQDWAELDALRARSGAGAMLWERVPAAETAAELAARGLEVILFEPGGDRGAVPFIERMRGNLTRLSAWADRRGG